MLLEDSTTYREILEKGLCQGERNVLLRVGAKKFGPPSATIVAAVQGISDPARLGRLTERLLEATNWEDLVGGS